MKPLFLLPEKSIQIFMSTTTVSKTVVVGTGY